jgi:hypothetical protein
VPNKAPLQDKVANCGDVRYSQVESLFSQFFAKWVILSSNLPELQRFLGNAHVYTTEFRPIELTQYFKIGTSLCSVETGNEERSLHQKRHPVNYPFSVSSIF